MSEFKVKLDSSSSESDDLNRLIDNTDELIASVYELFEQPRRVSPVMTPAVTPLGRSFSDDSNSTSGGRYTLSPLNVNTSPRTPPRSLSLRSPITTPRTPLSARLVAAAQTSTDLDADMSRIDSFCTMLEENLRSATTGESEVADTRWPAAATISPLSSPTTPLMVRSTPRTPERGREARGNTTPVAIIDLCDSMYLPSPLCPSVQAVVPPRLNCNDDVIIVSPSGVVDLCTPLRDRDNWRVVNASRNRRAGDNSTAVSNRNRSTISSLARRRLTQAQRVRPDDNATSRGTHSTIVTQSATQFPRSACMARCSVSTSTTNIQDNRDKDTQKAVVSPKSATGASESTEERSIMCAVCMENPLNKQPTSTKCGHVFCAGCINEAIKLTRKCPMCNTKLTSRMLFRIYV